MKTFVMAEKDIKQAGWCGTHLVQECQSLLGHIKPMEISLKPKQNKIVHRAPTVQHQACTLPLCTHKIDTDVYTHKWTCTCKYIHVQTFIHNAHKYSSHAGNEMKVQ